jgi:hypothetical protein
VLAVGADAVAKLHAQRALSKRRRAGAAERARPQGVGEDLLGELEFLVGDASSHHEFNPCAVTQGLMRHDRVGLLEQLVACLQLGFDEYFGIFHSLRGPQSRVRLRVGAAQTHISETINHLPRSLSQDNRLLHNLSSRKTSLRRGPSEPRHRLCNVSAHASPVVVAQSHVPLRTRLSGFGCLAPPLHGGGPVLRNASPVGGVDCTAPCLRFRDALLCSPLQEP